MVGGCLGPMLWRGRVCTCWGDCVCVYRRLRGGRRLSHSPESLAAAESRWHPHVAHAHPLLQLFGDRWAQGSICFGPGQPCIFQMGGPWLGAASLFGEGAQCPAGSEQAVGVSGSPSHPDLPALTTVCVCVRACMCVWGAPGSFLVPSELCLVIHPPAPSRDPQARWSWVGVGASGSALRGPWCCRCPGCGEPLTGVARASTWGVPGHSGSTEVRGALGGPVGGPVGRGGSFRCPATPPAASQTGASRGGPGRLQLYRLPASASLTVGMWPVAFLASAESGPPRSPCEALPGAACSLGGLSVAVEMS